ncbi:restriction endonuclease S subunit [Belliella baltica DSM 15883]|uniref:Restriction endonuclease S subunit n=1 Tax=Belliella baltica (strain DSM 15883 / CIP 108006 / LMG 21964 / BA134) TaxID=866536 RepID=I3Z193_BELBD|nr:restriction endonuclease subunit S [Belliella baltica]AFL83011.1 restriction endonuclease S subunit [Belliella baltica DSM 15883]
MKNYNSYDTYRYSSIAWIGDIPEHWEVRKLKYIFQIQKRIAGELGLNVLSITQKGIKIKDITSGGGQLAMDYSKYQRIYTGEFGMNHMDLLTGYVDISKYDGVISPDYRVFAQIDNESDKNYMLRLLQMCYKQKIFFAEGQGAAQLGRWRMPSDNFKNFLFPVPPKEEQTAIARFLDYKLAKINRFIQKKKQLLALYAERRKSLTKELVNSQNVKYLRLSSVANLIHRPIERLENELYTPVGLYNRGRGLFHKESILGKELGDSSFFYIKKGDVILSGQFAWEGSVALVDLEDDGCVASHRYPVLNCDLNVIIPEYLFSFFTISEGHLLLDYHSRGAAGRNRPLNPRYLIKEKIPVPDISLQKELIKLIERENELKAIIKKEISLVEEYKTALIAEAVTGKIDVRGYDVPEISEEETYEEIEEEISMAAEDGEEYQTIEE